MTCNRTCATRRKQSTARTSNLGPCTAHYGAVDPKVPRPGTRAWARSSARGDATATASNARATAPHRHLRAHRCRLAERPHTGCNAAARRRGAWQRFMRTVASFPATPRHRGAWARPQSSIPTCRCACLGREHEPSPARDALHRMRLFAAPTSGSLRSSAPHRARSKAFLRANDRRVGFLPARRAASGRLDWTP
jgi:hypothetical protein